MEYAIIIWFVIIVAAFVIEMQTMDLTSIWFGAGALAGFILAIAKAPWWAQLAAFAVVTFLLIILVRPITQKYLKTNVVHTNTDRLIGKVATCTRKIAVGERGEVKIDGKFWTAVSTSDDDIDLEEKVEVLAVEGVKLVVDKIK
jgi:membrane protein implicated in regulation of membrane protease activity